MGLPAEPTAGVPVMVSASPQASGLTEPPLSGFGPAIPGGSPLEWGLLAVSRGEIGRQRRGGIYTVGSGGVPATAPPAAGGGLPITPPGFAPGEVLVGWKPGADALGRETALQAIQAKVMGTSGTQEMLLTGEAVDRLQVPGGTEAAIRALANNPAVAFAEPNYLVSSVAIAQDTYYASGALWGMQSDDSPTVYGPAGTTNEFGSGAEEAWGRGYTGSSDVVIAVIDEGIQISHPDLAANIWVNPGEIPGDGIDNDGNGYADDVNGWDFYYNDASVYDAGEDDHGTHVAGTIGALGGNGIGVAGVAWNVGIIPAKFLGPGGGYISDAVAALDYLTDLKTRYDINLVAVNNSWGGGNYSSAMHGAIIRAAKQGILFVAAAGNDSENNDFIGAYPSNYSSLQASATESAASYESVIAVASITSTGALSGFSSYGSSTVDLGAPGSGIISAVPNDSYANYSGTSMATPHVTGAIALYASYEPTADAEALRNAILGNVKPTASLSGKTVTGGRLSLEGLFGDDSGLPVVSIGPVSVEVAEGDSGSAVAEFAVSLSQAAVAPVSVGYATVEGSAVAGLDFTADSGLVSFGAGQSSQVVSVAVLGDGLVEGDESFSVVLSGPAGAVLGNAEAVVVIADDDAPVAGDPVVSIGPVSVEVAEGDSGSSAAEFTVSLSQAAVAPVSVGYATVEGSAVAGLDFTADSGLVSFGAGQSSQVVSVAVLGDGLVEGDESFSVVLSGPAGAVLGNASAVVVIADDDMPVVSIESVSTQVAEGSDSAEFTVSLSQATAGPVTVNYVTSDYWSGLYGFATPGQDYLSSSGVVSFAAGETAQTISVPLLEDTVVEPDERLDVDLSAPVGAVLGQAWYGTVYLADDDVPVVSIGPVSVEVAEGDSGSAVAEFAVSLSQAAVAPVSVRYATVEGSAVAGLDFTADSGLVSFGAGQSSQVVSVAVLGDGLVEGDESFSVVLSGPAGAVLGDAEAVVVIADDDVPVVNPVAAFFGQIGAFVGQIFETVGQIITQLVQAVTQIFAGIFGGLAPSVPADPAPAAGSPGADGSSVSASPLTGVSVGPVAPGTAFPGGASTPQTAA